MTILFAGSSVADFDDSGYFFDSPNYSLDGRGIAMSNGNARRAIKTLDSVVTGNVWLGFNRGEEVYNANGDDWDLADLPTEAYIVFYDGENNPMLFFGFNANTGSEATSMQARVYLTDGTTVDLTDIVLPSLIRDVNAAVDKFDIRVTPGSGFSVYHNRELVYTYTGNVGNSASTVNGVGKLEMGGPDDYTTTVYSNIVLATTSTIYMRVKPVVLSTTPSVDTSSAAGTRPTTEFVSGHFMNEYDSEAYNAFDAVGEKIIFPENDTITLETNHAIAGVVLSYRAFETGASPVTTLTPTLNIASTDYTGTGLSVTTTRKNHQYVFTTNPATGSAWTESDLENIGYGLTVNT